MIWEDTVASLEKGISPDGLPINPERKVVSRFHSENGKVLSVLREDIEGHFSYYYYKNVGFEIIQVKGWYTVRKR